MERTLVRAFTFSALSWVVLAWAAVVPGALAPGALTPAEQRGKQIYLQGKSPGGGEIVAVLGEGGAEVAASLMPCGSCHGADGRGRPEGGAVPSDITWPALTRAGGVRHASGREHPAYDERGVIKAIALGFDPAGNALSPVMPRYRLSQQDAADLVAYLKRIADDRDPGIGEAELTLGLVLPPDPSAATAVEAVLGAWAAEVNARGGLYARKLRWARSELAGTPAERAAALAGFLEREKPFALVAPFLAGAEREMAAVLTAQGVPAVGAFALEPAFDRQVFYLYAGARDQALAVVDRLAAAAPDAWALVVGDDPGRAGATLADQAAAVVERATAKGLAAPLRLPHAGAADAARAAGAKAVVFLGDSEAAGAFLEQAAARDWRPLFLAPGLSAGARLLGRSSAFRGTVVLSFPTLSSDLRPASVAELEKFSGKHGGVPSTRVARAAALVAAKLTLNALTQLGRDLSRAALVHELEGVYRFETGLTPPLTFGPNTRVGAAGAWVVDVDPASGAITAGEWVKVE